MSRVAVLGAGAGGASAVADLTQRGYAVRWWSRTDDRLAPFRAAGGIRYEGVLGSGLALPEAMSADLPAILAGADVALVCLPATALESLAGGFIATGASLPIVLDPGGTCGSLLVAETFRRARRSPPPIAELSTLTYIARLYAPDAVTVTAAVGRVRTACLPEGDAALRWVRELYSAARPERDVLATSLSNPNLLLHPPGSLMALAWIEATGGDFRFYADGVTPAVGRVIAALDAERRAVAAEFGHELPGLLDEMAVLGTVDSDAARTGDYAAAIADGKANRQIPAPDSLGHRYFTEDICCALVPFVALARIADVPVPVATSLLGLAQAAMGTDPDAVAAFSRRLGIDGLRTDELRRRLAP